MTESMWLSRLSPPVSQDNLSLKVMKTQSSRLTYRNDEDGISYGSSSPHIKTGELFLTRSNKILQTVIFSWAASSDEKYQANDEIATAIGWASSPLLLAGVTSSSSLIATGGLPGQHSSASLIGGISSYQTVNISHLTAHHHYIILSTPARL